MLDSFETEKLVKLIDAEKKSLDFFTKQNNKWAAQKVQNKIMFLQNEILPIVLKNTTTTFYDIGKYAILCYNEAVKRKCNGVFIYLPISNEYNEQPKIAVANCRDYFGISGGIMICCNEVEIFNIDGIGNPNKIEVLTIPIHELL